MASITVTPALSAEGRLLARTARVTLDNNVIGSAGRRRAARHAGSPPQIVIERAHLLPADVAYTPVRR